MKISGFQVVAAKKSAKEFEHIFSSVFASAIGGRGEAALLPAFIAGVLTKREARSLHSWLPR
jgi:hypothetical protein